MIEFAILFSPLGSQLLTGLSLNGFKLPKLAIGDGSFEF
jgi:hypothetical protein